MEGGVMTPEHRQPSDGRGHLAERRVFVVSADAWDAMTAALERPAHEVLGLHELISTPTVLDG